MPTSEVRAALASALLALSACAGGLGAGAPASVSVAQGALTIAGPQGYCIDRGLSRIGAAEAFVVLGACNALASGGARPFGQPAVLTATVSAARDSEPDLRALERFLRSQQGRAAISRTGRAETVEVLSTRVEADALHMHIRDTSAAAEGPATDPGYWRAVFDLNGHLVTATLMAFADRPLARDEGFRTLAEFVARLRAANSSPAS